MTTLAGENHETVIQAEEDLLSYFPSFAKARNQFRVGIEAEFFGVDRATGRALPYEGKRGIHEILKALVRKFQYGPILDEGNIIGLKKSDEMISLEPGGQLELSAPPVLNVFEMEEQLRRFIEKLRPLTHEFPAVTWLAVGFHPFSRLDEIPWVPKRRYKIMAEYLGGRGTQSHEMMKRTCTNQINVDYLSEEHAMQCLRVALGITSIVTALFAHSGFSEGKPDGFLSRRLDVWNHTDPERTGLLVDFTHPEKRFKDYLDYLLEMPVIFIVRQGGWYPVQRLTFRQYLREGFQGFKPTIGDFELHLSTAFPEVRLKQYLEVRGVDCQRRELIPAVAAFWKGILYNAAARKVAWRLVSFASDADRLNLHHEVPRKGLHASLGVKPILPIARELVEISCASLGKQTTAEETRSECIFLDRIREAITRPGKSPAETLLEKWEGEFKRNPERLIEYLSILD